MNVADRLKLIQMIEKFNTNKDFSRKLGVRDVSVFKNSQLKGKGEK